MLIKICDRCGDQISEQGEQKVKEPRKYAVLRNNEISHRLANGQYIFERSDVDFCPICQRLFDEFMNGYDK